MDEFNSCFSHVQTFDTGNATGIYAELRPHVGSGYLWLYEQPGVVTVCRRDFSFTEDIFIEAKRPACLTVTYHESISGEEFDPYFGLSSDSLKVAGHDDYTYRVLVHKGVPVRSIYVEIYPEFWDAVLRSCGRKEIPNYLDITIRSSSSESHLIVQHLQELAGFKGKFSEAQKFYEQGVAEIASILADEYDFRSSQRMVYLSDDDKRHMEGVVSYLNDHYYFDVPLDCLAHIAGMGTTKLKAAFRQITGCTITEYVHQKRMRYAAHLLAHTDFPIAQIAEMVGYTTPSRFAELFKRDTGSLPLEYRKLTQGK